MTYTTPEITEMRQKVLDQILAHPEQHNQNNFGEKTECGTTMCIAGWAVTLDPNTEVSFFTDYPLVNPRVITENGPMDIEYRAGELLGLEDSYEQVSLFYDMDNDSALRRLKHLADTGELPAKEGV